MRAPNHNRYRPGCGLPPSDDSTSGGTSNGTTDPVDPVGGDTCCDVGGGATLDGGKVVVTESYVITTDTWPSGSGSCSQTTVTSSKTYSDGTTEYSSRTSGIDCVSIDGGGTIKTAANTFEECPECPTPTDGSIGILPPRDSTEEVVSEEEQIINNLTGKADCVYQKLLNSSTSFANAIRKFDGEFPVANLKFNLDDLADGERGRTIPPGHPQNPDPFLILIQLNNDSSISGVNFRPNLLTAKTIIHEVIHAEMFRKLMELAGSNGSIDTSILRTMLEQGDYPGMLDYYTRFGLNGFQHQQMAQHYRETIARSLQEFDTGLSVPSGQQPLQLYMDLAWEGLNHSNILAWNKATAQEERNRIDQVIANYIQEHKNENCQ